MRVGCIYALVDPVTDDVRYIGKTIRTPEVRLSRHVMMAKNGAPSYVYCWMRTLPEPPHVTVIEVVPENELDDAERHWIHIMRLAGARLTNLTAGGNGGALQGEARERMLTKLRSPEIRARIAAGRRGYVASPETRAKQSAAQRARTDVLSDETRAKLSASGRGRKRSPEVQARITEAIRNRTSEFYEMVAAKNRGRKQTLEARANMSAAQRRRWERDGSTPSEVRGKISAASRGKKRSDETREKQRRSWTPERRAAYSEYMRTEGSAKVWETRRRKAQEDADTTCI